jgi:hypothetical protein
MKRNFSEFLVATEHVDFLCVLDRGGAELFASVVTQGDTLHQKFWGNVFASTVRGELTALISIQVILLLVGLIYFTSLLELKCAVTAVTLLPVSRQNYWQPTSTKYRSCRRKFRMTAEQGSQLLSCQTIPKLIVNDFRYFALCLTKS